MRSSIFLSSSGMGDTTNFVWDQKLKKYICNGNFSSSGAHLQTDDLRQGIVNSRSNISQSSSSRSCDQCGQPVGAEPSSSSRTSEHTVPSLLRSPAPAPGFRPLAPARRRHPDLHLEDPVGGRHHPSGPVSSRTDREARRPGTAPAAESDSLSRGVGLQRYRPRRHRPRAASRSRRDEL